MGSLWADYFREKGYVVIENDRGFMSAIIRDGVCFVDNFYVRPQSRGTREALNLTQALIAHAEQAGCTAFAAEIYKSDPMYAYILRLHMHFGMKTIDDNEFKTITSKRIGHDQPITITASR